MTGFVLDADVIIALELADRGTGLAARGAFHPEAIAVLQDKAALRRGVEELRGRVLSFHGFVGELVARGHLNWTEARALAVRYRRQYGHARIPVWWPSE